ncbi:MAG: hypothetical protein V2B18_19530 [Pseudomonadota bacterium]
MGLRRTIKLFRSYPPYIEFARSQPPAVIEQLDSSALRAQALRFAETIEPKGDRSELEMALAAYEVRHDAESFGPVSSMLHFLVDTLFRDISPSVPDEVRERIRGYSGPLFFFVGHSSYYDYPVVARSLSGLDLHAPVMHVSGSITTGWLSNWLKGLRYIDVPKTFSEVQHRAYTWFSAAVAGMGPAQTLFARTSRYTVRARDGILREPYVPHGLLASVKAVGKALVVPVAISYAIIPEDRDLSVSTLFPTLSVFPRNWASLIPRLFHTGGAHSVFRSMEKVFGEVCVNICEPFELTDNGSLTQQRIAHRAIEEIARNKLIHPSHMVAGAIQGMDRCDMQTLRNRVAKEVDNTRAFFRTRYHREPPFHPSIDSDLPEAIQEGKKILMERGALGRSLWNRRYYPKNAAILQYYGYHGDRRIYPLSGRNSMTVINAGVWGYTLALHIGANLLRKPELAEHSLVLYDSREDLIEKLTVDGRHPWHFKDIPLPRSVRPEADLMAAIRDTSLILLVPPSKYFYSTVTRILELAPDGCDLVVATKGFIPETGLLPCQTMREEMERIGKRMHISILSGANLAHEIACGGAGVTQIACEEWSTFERLRTLIETPKFRVVYSPDIIGTTIAAALKNVYAIGFGILEGSKVVPENFLATYATLATAEIRQFGLLLGAAPETFDAESQVWMADLLATCRGGRSARFGRDLAALDEKHGKYLPARVLLDQYRKKMLAVEGFDATRFAQRMAAQRGFHPPILGEIYSVLHGGKKVDVDGLVDRCLDALGRQDDRQKATRISYRKRPM